MTAGAIGRLASVLLLGAVAATGCDRRPAAEDLPVLLIGGDFQLTDHDSRPFTLTALRGKVVLIFFGYSSCPDACPTTLSKLSSVARRLGDDRARLQALYISVDPDRDTPAVLKADLENFSIGALGLTGTKEAIDAVVAQYAAAYEIVPTPESAASLHHLAHHRRLRARSAGAGADDLRLRGLGRRDRGGHPPHPGAGALGAATGARVLSAPGADTGRRT
ncbi:MAG: SCO family protein [Vicinamibacterales bacterium]